VPQVAVVADTTHYLPPDLVAAGGLHQVSLYVNWQGRQDREADLPDYDGYYAHLRTAAELPTTSQPSPGDFAAVYEPLLAAGRDIVSIHISSTLSGTHATALAARDRLAESHGERRIVVMDSATGAGGLGLVVLAAQAAARAGADVDGVLERARQAREALKLWFCVDTMEYLRRGGRIGAARAWLGTTLKVKPILTFESEIEPVERVRTAGRVFERMADYLRARRDDGADGWIVQHVQAPEQAQRLVERGRELFDADPAFVSEIGPVLGTHLGPGLVGVGGVPARLLR
jgi:DegV family protein with EDD domain